MAGKKFLRLVNNLVTEVLGIQTSAGAANAGDIDPATTGRVKCKAEYDESMYTTSLDTSKVSGCSGPRSCVHQCASRPSFDGFGLHAMFAAFCGFFCVAFSFLSRGRKNT